jgi:hypothetical protein
VFPEKLPPHELLYYLHPSDIQLILKCNERTARDYREALKDIYFEYQSSSLQTSLFYLIKEEEEDLLFCSSPNVIQP